MQKRLLLAVLIIAALFGLFAVYWFVLRPVLPGGNQLPSQPPALNQRPPEVPFNPETPSVQKQATTTIVDASSPEEKERQAQNAAQRAAMDIAARVGSYSNANNFDDLRVMQANVGKDYAAKLAGLREQLMKDHPSFGPSWGQTLRSLSASISSESIPVIGKDTIEVSVQGQRTIESNGASTTSYSLVTLTLQKKDDGWMAIDAQFSDLVR